MSNISAADVKELREITNIGMMKCKAALVEADGDKEKALKILKEKGLAVAAKRADRDANEGKIFVNTNGHKGHMVAVGCETDFVAKNADFIALVAEIGENFQEKGSDYINSDELKDRLTETTAKVGEKIEVKESAVIEAEGFVQSYLHGNEKVGVLVEIVCPAEAIDNQKVKEFAKDIAMQVAAMNPLGVTENEIPQSNIDEQREVFKSQLADSGKPAEILDKIIDGKLKKYFSELCLIQMDFIKDGKLKIKDLVTNISKEIGSEVVIKSFKRFQIGQ